MLTIRSLSLPFGCLPQLNHARAEKLFKNTTSFHMATRQHQPHTLHPSTPPPLHPSNIPTNHKYNFKEDYLTRLRCFAIYFVLLCWQSGHSHCRSVAYCNWIMQELRNVFKKSSPFTILFVVVVWHICPIHDQNNNMHWPVPQRCAFFFIQSSVDRLQFNSVSTSSLSHLGTFKP